MCGNRAICRATKFWGREGEGEGLSSGRAPSVAAALTQAGGQVPLPPTPHYHLLLRNSSSSTSLSGTEPSTTVSSLSVSLSPPLPRPSMVRPLRSPGASSGSRPPPSAAAAILWPGRAAPRVVAGSQRSPEARSPRKQRAVCDRSSECVRF